MAQQEVTRGTTFNERMQSTFPGRWGNDDEAKRRVLNRIRWMASELDRKWKFCGCFRFGYDSVLSIIPGGTFVGMGFSLYLYALAHRFQLPLRTRLLMLWRILIDLLLGAIPLLGFFADALFKANLKNMRSLEKKLVASLPPERVENLGIPLDDEGQPYNLMTDKDDGGRADEIVRDSKRLSELPKEIV